MLVLTAWFIHVLENKIQTILGKKAGHSVMDMKILVPGECMLSCYSNVEV